jgi:hypothetical protein
MNAVPPPPEHDPDDERLGRALHASRALADAPEALVLQAIALFDGLRTAPRRVPRAGLPRLLAALQFDSGAASPLAFGRRSASAEQRQLLYTLEGCDVDLRIASADTSAGPFEVSGQLLGPDSQGVVFAQALGADDTEPASAALNEFGEFRLPPLPAGRWRLTLELSHQAIELPALELPPGVAAG